MKIKRLVGLLAELTPHAYSDNVVLMWLSQCENSILTDVFLIAPEETVEYETVTEDKLLVPHPYDKLYLPYLQAQVAHANQEYDLYANLIALYNAYRYEYAQYIVDGADPGSGDAVARGYFLSAYGVAVAHGYAGTEEEWIASLKGATGAPGEPGMSAYEAAKEQGFDGTEAEWLASLEGKSAYEVALEEGFEGTPSEWLESIKGPAGRSTVLAYAPADGQSYTAQAEGVVAEQGCEIVLVPQSTNQGAATLALNGGAAYPMCIRPGWNKSGNDLKPQLTLPLEAGMLLRGGEYVFRFDGAAWVLQSYISDQKAEVALNKATTAENTANAAAEDAEEARLLAEDAEQTAITAISMGNHVIRASTADGVSYVAPKSDTLPAITTGTAGGHKGKGTRIVLIPNGPNTVASPTLKIGAGEVIPIRLRSASNKGNNDGAPDATDDVPVGAMMAGVPYVMTFCGKYWLIDSLIGGIGGGKIYVSDTKPEGLKPGDGWVDTSEELEAPVTQGQMETYVADALKFHNTFDGLFVESFLNLKSIDGDGGVRMSVEGTNGGKDQRLILLSDRNAPRLCGIGDPTEERDAATKKYVDEAIAQAGGSGGAAATDITDTVMEWLEDENMQYVSPAESLLYLANTLYTQYPPGNYVAFEGMGRFEILRIKTFGVSIVRVNFDGNSAELSVDEAGAWNGAITTYESGSGRAIREEAYIANNNFAKYRLFGLSEPVDDTDAANKKYVDDAIAAALDGIALAEEGSY